MTTNAQTTADWHQQATRTLDCGEPTDLQSKAFMFPDDAKLRALAEFAAGAGHEINNPVATIAGHAQRLLRDEIDPDRRHALLTIGAQAYRIRDMIADVMLFARPPQPQFTEVDLGSVVRTAVETLRKDHPQHEVDVAISGATRIHADATQAAVVVSELLRNAVQAAEGSARIQVAVRDDPPGTVRLEISDTGRGLSELDCEHLFDPFYSGRQAGRGLGFGLCKVWRIVTLHGGTVDVESGSGRTTFTVRWPAA
jgi:signal transduction histidine kinase